MGIALGQRAISKRTGLPQTGYVVGLVHPNYVQEVLLGPFSRWNELYPDWKENPVYILRLDQPSKPVTREEFVSQNPDAADGEYESIPEFRYSYYPFDDLEELE
jgi:hypothetical protein